VTAAEQPGEGAAPLGSDPQTRQRLLEAGIDCMVRYGRSKTTLQDVAAAAGLSRATLYRYFPDRQAMLAAIRDYETAREAKEFERRLSEAPDLRAAVEAVATVLVSTSSRYRVNEHLSAGDEGLAAFVAASQPERRDRVVTLLAPHVRRAHETGELAVAVDEALEWIALVVGQIFTLPRLSSVDATDPVAVGAWLARRCCHGLLLPRDT
jgi:AcrR family transcriptional regulator